MKQHHTGVHSNRRKGTQFSISIMLVSVLYLLTTNDTESKATTMKELQKHNTLIRKTTQNILS